MGTVSYLCGLPGGPALGQDDRLTCTDLFDLNDCTVVRQGQYERLISQAIRPVNNTATWQVMGDKKKCFMKPTDFAGLDYESFKVVGLYCNNFHYYAKYSSTFW